MKKKLKPLAEFKIFPIEGEEWHYIVKVFATREELKQCGIEENIDNGDSDNYAGFCTSYTKESYATGKRVFSPDIGVIGLWKEKLFSEIISHECTHATTYFIHRFNLKRRIFTNHDADEFYALMQGSLTGQIVNKLYEFKMYD